MDDSQVSRLVIIGNGFDLHHGLATGYGDFVKSGLTGKSFDRLLIYAKETGYDVKQNNWYNFEELFRQVILKYQENPSGDANNGEKPSESIKSINEFFHDLMHDLKMYLTNISVSTKNYKIDSTVAATLYNADKILTFNYTNVLERLYGIDASKIIHIHGSLEKFPIFGHSNYLKFDQADGSNYGVDLVFQSISSFMNSGAATTINAKTWEVTCNTEPPETMHGPKNIETCMFGDKNMQRYILSTKSENDSNSHGFTSSSCLKEIYDNPFSSYPDEIKAKNYLKMDFAEHLCITVIGHGLRSDIDLLDKIKAEKKLIKLFNGPSYFDNELSKRAERAFGVGSENTVNVEYEW